MNQSASRNDRNIGARWFVVKIKPRQEAVAKQNLENQAFPVYLPYVKSSKHRNGQWREKMEVLFPGYLFVSLNLSIDNIAPIRSTRGVISLVRFGEKLVPIDSEIIQLLQEREAYYLKSPVDHTKRFTEGDTVNIVGGSFNGLEGVFQMPKSADRVLVLVRIFGGQKLVSLDVNRITNS